MARKFHQILALTSAALLAAGLLASSAPALAHQNPDKQILQRRAELQKVLDRYAAGDYKIVTSTFEKVDGVTRLAMRFLMGDKTAPYDRARVAFALDVNAAFIRAGNLFDVDGLARDSADIIARRPLALGVDADEDRFELLCHQIALALLARVGDWSRHRAYLIHVSPRLTKLEAAYPAMPNRLPLIRAMDAVMHCCTRLLLGRLDQLVTVVVKGSRPAPPPPPNPAYALVLFDHAAKFPALRQEALVRAAYLEERQGHVKEGLALLDRAESAGDAIIDYAAWLIRAGLFDRQGAAEAAAEAYGSALNLAPGAQVPAIGRAAALQRAGRIDEAASAAEHARRMPAEGLDPWPAFNSGDGRFVDEWLGQLRTMLR